MHRLALFVLGTALGTAQAADARTSVDYAAQAGPGSSVLIKPMRPSGDAQYWCAAADYMRGTFGSAGTARIYVTEARSRGAARFALDPPASGPVTTFSISVGTVGNNMSVAEAQQFCYNQSIN